MSGNRTIRLVRSYVAKIQDNPFDSEYSEYAVPLDEGEYQDETASAKPVTHKDLLLSSAMRDKGGFFIVTILISDVTIFMDDATHYTCVMNLSHVNFLRPNAR